MVFSVIFPHNEIPQNSKNRVLQFNRNMDNKVPCVGNSREYLVPYCMNRVMKY